MRRRAHALGYPTIRDKPVSALNRTLRYPLRVRIGARREGSTAKAGDRCSQISRPLLGARERARCVESRCGAVAVGRTYLFPPLSSGGASLVRPWLRLHIPLIEPDMRIYRIRLSDKTSRLHSRRAAPKPGQAYEPEVLVEVREWIGSALAPPDFVLEAQPPAQPHSRVGFSPRVPRSGVGSSTVQPGTPISPQEFRPDRRCEMRVSAVA